MEKCLNCGTAFSGNYCNNCGQKKIDGALTIQMIFSDFLQFVFLPGSSFLQTLKGLFLRSGILVKSFIEGKRKRYLHPFRFFCSL